VALHRLEHLTAVGNLWGHAYLQGLILSTASDPALDLRRALYSWKTTLFLQLGEVREEDSSDDGGGYYSDFDVSGEGGAAIAAAVGHLLREAHLEEEERLGDQLQPLLPSLPTAKFTLAHGSDPDSGASLLPEFIDFSLGEELSSLEFMDWSLVGGGGGVSTPLPA